MCINGLAKTKPELEEFAQTLPRIGYRLAPFLLGPSVYVGVEEDTTLPPSQKATGRVKSYNTRKGFGFIDVPGYQRDIFVYNAHLIGRIGLIAGESVEFELTIHDGRPQARQVKVVAGVNNKVNAGVNPLNTLKQAMADAQPTTGSMRDVQ